MSSGLDFGSQINAFTVTVKIGDFKRVWAEVRDRVTGTEASL